MRHADNPNDDFDLLSPKEMARTLAGALLLVSLALLTVELCMPVPML
jgi:hypothetical protein